LLARASEGIVYVIALWRFRAQHSAEAQA